VVAFPVTAPDGTTTDDPRAFISHDTVGQIGVKFGVLANARDAGVASNGNVFVRAVPESAPSHEDIKIEPAQVHLAFDHELAAAISGQAGSDHRRAVLVGAGALGSQIAMSLAREGRFRWAIIDSDHLLPHNLGRHALLSDELGVPKAIALARQIGFLLNEEETGLVADVTKPDEQLSKELADADIIIDASASVAVSRHLADLEDSRARRGSLFFNPAGTAVVLLAENADRSITLRDLEAQYHRLIQTSPPLKDHLRAVPGLRYTGSCRAATNRIPSNNAALLSALGTRGLVDALGSDHAAVRLWSIADGGSVEITNCSGALMRRLTLCGWAIAYGDDLLTELTRLRESRLPNETGGVLLGIADISRKSIHVAHALPEPADSRSSPEGFERGIVGLKTAVNDAVERSLSHLSYVGEWHSHPRRSSPHPSTTDVEQIVWLTHELENEGLPALMAIAADNGTFAFVMAEAGPRLP
jgi:integrative and conjugative element protein (TIGR02256 family)